MLRGGTKVAGSAQPCQQFETAVVLRDPVDRTRSHIIELRKVYARCVKALEVENKVKASSPPPVCHGCVKIPNSPLS
jgi:hypothetical protein